MDFYGSYPSGLLLLFPTCIQVGPDDSLTDVALTILRNEISSVPVIHSPEDGSCPQLLHIACLAGILKRMFS